ncbi:uncharacterized protein LOC103702387 isoform X2 [Phoenix dactylifera]|uniref:Uncharacterized protein LOC103702387 isoform X2 n=1 Tax=Phoenix dactylifera TaxID=42345 RepID=A0A8B7MT38_PHODC|nr:uncharacterized protein LOC103702387 isoform X2 [Phoenix dactylifera]
MLSSKSCPILSCHYPLPSLHHPQKLFHRTHSILKPKTLNPGTGLRLSHPFSSVGSRGLLQVCRDSTERKNFGGSFLDEKGPTVERSGDGGGSGNDWTTSVLLFGLWAGLMYYVFQLAPNQTPASDVYYLQKLLNLKGDDGFQMNEVLVALWYFMGLWPFIYSMLLVPTGRSSRSKIPVWPFLVLSFFGGAYALIPYFVFWKPPPPALGEDEIRRWPLNFLDSKIAAGILLVAGLGLTMYAGLANGDVWKEFFRYFRESKFIHITCIDFTLLSAFAPFWVYNDMTARRWINQGSWLLPVACIPILGPSLYLLLRPPLSALPMSTPSVISEKE